jgi:Nif-specific regulatory protein
VQRLVIELDEGGFVDREMLSPRMRKIESVLDKSGVAKGSLREMMDTVEKFFLAEALREHNQNKTSAAKALGITREGLHKKLRQLKMG